MAWKGVTVKEERQRFLEDFRLRYYTITELAERFGISRKTAHKWIDRFEQGGQEGLHELSRRPHSSRNQTDPAIVKQIVDLRLAHPRWGPAVLLDLLQRRRPHADLPSIPTAARILARHGPILPSAATVEHTQDVPRRSRKGPTTSGRPTTRGSSG